MLDTTRRRQRRLRLLDLYGRLLTEHQRRILHFAWEEDWSYGEVSEREGVSRTAIYDIVRRTGRSLETYERKLRLDRDGALRARSIDHVRRRVITLERQVGALARLIEKTS